MENEESMKIDEEIANEVDSDGHPSNEKRGGMDEMTDQWTHNNTTRSQDKTTWTQVQEGYLMNPIISDLKDYSDLNEFWGLKNHMFWLSLWGASTER